MIFAVNVTSLMSYRRWAPIIRSSGTCGILLAIMTTMLLPVDSAVAGEKELSKLIAKKTAILSMMHKKAKKALVNSAQDTVFDTYFQAENNEKQRLAKTKIEKLALNVQKNFQVEEMCLINRTGLELVRIVGNAIALDEDLSAEEASATFFETGFAAKRRKVVVSPLYMSPDAKKWVLAYTTPIVIEGNKKAILHYEHGLGVFQNALNKGVSGPSLYVIAVTSNGFVISDSRKKIALNQKGQSDNMVSYFSQLNNDLAKVLKNSKGSPGSTTIRSGGKKRAVAFAPLQGGLTLMAIELM